MSSPERTVALIVAAGSGSRVGGELPKQFRLVRGQPMLRHSYATLSYHPAIDAVYVAIGEGQNELALTSLADLPLPQFLIGGATRRESVQKGLQAIAADGAALNEPDEKNNHADERDQQDQKPPRRSAEVMQSPK